MARHCVDEDIDILTKQLITSLIGFQVIIVIVGISCLITNHIVPLWGCPFPRNRTKPDETEQLLSSNVLQKCIK